MAILTGFPELVDLDLNACLRRGVGTAAELLADPAVLPRLRRCDLRHNNLPPATREKLAVSGRPILL